MDWLKREFPDEEWEDKWETIAPSVMKRRLRLSHLASVNSEDQMVRFIFDPALAVLVFNKLAQGEKIWSFT